AGARHVAIQAVCRPQAPTTPAMGGLLLWRNEEQYLCLDWGTKGPHQVTLGGCLPGRQFPALVRWGRKGVILGRGYLPAERAILRLERRGGWVRALCSAEGRHWFTIGQVEFPADEPLEAGLHAIGTIDRMIYPGAFPHGTALR